MKCLLNIYLYSIVILFTLALCPFVVFYLILLKIFFSERFFLRRLRRFVAWYGLITIRGLLFPFIRISFTDAAKDEHVAPCIFVCNHRSSSDPYLLSLLPYEIVQIVSDWPFRIPLLGVVAKLSGYISIKEMSYDDLSATTEKLLKEGVCLGVFPEGTRSGSNKMGQFHGALFRVALKAKCPIVPLCIVGNENIPTRDFVLNTGKIRVKKLSAICYDEYKDMTPFKLKNYVRDIIVKETASMEKSII